MTKKIYVSKKEVLDLYGKEITDSLLTLVFNAGCAKEWESLSSLLEFNRDYGFWYVDSSNEINGISSLRIGQIDYMKVSPKKFFEYFLGENFEAGQHAIVKKVASPRYRKPRIKPLKRKNTTIIVHYTTGESYTLKNVTLLEWDATNKPSKLIIAHKKVHTKETYSVVYSHILTSSVDYIEVFSPDLTGSIYVKKGKICGKMGTLFLGANYVRKDFSF